MDRLDERLRELETEVIETRNVTIKSDNSLRNLSTEIRQIIRRQELWERRTLVNSAVAYILFAALSFGGLWFFFQASASRNAVDQALVDAGRRGLETRIQELEAELERRRQSEREAYDFVTLLVSGREDEVVERWPAVQGRLVDRATIELFRREVDRIRHHVAREAYESGRALMARDAWEPARDAFTRSLAWVDRAPYTVELHAQLGLALFQLADYAGAVRYIDEAIDGGTLARADLILVMFRRAEALTRLEREQEGMDAYRAFVRRFPEHSWANTARSRIQRYEQRVSP